MFSANDAMLSLGSNVSNYYTFSLMTDIDKKTFIFVSLQLSSYFICFTNTQAL